MISHQHVLDAVRIATKHRRLEDESNELVAKMARALEISQRKNQFDGSIYSALECLTAYSYDVRHLFPSQVLQNQEAA